ncbi:AAA family ATPase [Sorangium sp. So ce327]|jgi:energy-coupling factor transporter ATP-binding protein EcfA2|uniref:AAA family ATPase n=1 Tax=Sorangium sp. So ce327 TaxID=3133301 RepID=UPI003F60E6FE
MLKLRRLRIEKFRGVAPGTELRFSDGLNVLLGQNGTGKTTLLELISMVVRSDFSSLAREEFAVEYELAVPEEATVTVAVSNKEKTGFVGTKDRPRIDLPERWFPVADVTIEDSSPGASRRIRYDVERGLTVGDHEPIEGGWEISCLNAGFLWAYMLLDPEFIVTPTYNRVRDASSARRFDESLELFTWLTGSSDARRRVFVLRERVLYAGIKSDLLPNALLRQLGSMYEPSRSDYTFKHSDLDFLATIKGIMGFDAAELKVDVTERNARGELHEYLTLGDLVFRFWWEGGEFITHTRLSYGQKRLLTFFYYLACNDDIVIADELVNGLHHHWIAACVEALGQRQAFLTSQNPLLLDYIPITSPEQVHDSFVLCRGERRGGRPAWGWANMSEEDAAEFFAAYEVGVEHVSEILQSRGLW